MAHQYTNIRAVLDRLRMHPLLSDITLENVLLYTTDFIRIVGAPKMFTTRTAEVEITEHRGNLPCDWVQTNQVRIKRQGSIPMGSTTSPFGPGDNIRGDGLTFRVQGDIIQTSLRNGVVEISYQAWETDQEGLPLIPENSSFLVALTAYIKKEVFTVLFDTGKVTQASLNQALQDYCWAVGVCESEFHRMDLSEMEALANSFTRMIHRTHEFKKGFYGFGADEVLRPHR